ncbi:unnamed protein product, partial [marine sediment metagenome]
NYRLSADAGNSFRFRINGLSVNFNAWPYARGLD